MQKQMEVEQKYDQQQIQLAKNALEKEESEKIARKFKAVEAKKVRDEMLREAQSVKQSQIQRSLQEEKELLQKLKVDLD